MLIAIWLFTDSFFFLAKKKNYKIQKKMVEILIADYKLIALYTLAQSCLGLCSTSTVL